MVYSLLNILSGFIPVLLMALAVHGGEEECLGLIGQGPIKCYDCSTDKPHHSCGDRFNDTHPDVEVVACSGYCVKWHRETKYGKYFIRRTCSTSLDISMRINAVCMEESRPSSGRLCFCDRDKCNAATSLTSTSSPWTLLTLLALLHGLFHVIGIKVLPGCRFPVT